MRAAIYSWAVAAVFAILPLYVLWEAGVIAGERKVAFSAPPNDLGMTTAFQLFHLTNIEGEGVVVFDPVELQKTKICELQVLNSDTYWTMSLEYLDRYSACFISNVSGNRISVAPNTYSGRLKIHQKNKYYCGCPDVDIKKDLQTSRE